MFFSYPETIPALEWAGIDHVALGNNHTNDYLEYGVSETLKYLRRSSLGYSGVGLSEREALQAYETSIGGTPYSFLGYVGWTGSSIPSQVAEADSSGAAYGSLSNIQSTVSRSANNSVVVASYHGSSEYSEQPTQQTRKRLEAAINAGADLVVAHHPHVLHGLALSGDKLIAYSMGNFAFDQYIYETQRSMLLYVWMDGEKFHRAEIVPLYIKAYRPTPATGRMREYVLRRLKYLSAQESTAIELSGGHGVISLRKMEAAHSSEEKKISLLSGEIENFHSLAWNQELKSVSVDSASATVRVGFDWWGMGDFEQQGLFDLPESSWRFSNPDSNTSADKAYGRYSMKLVKSKEAGETSATQKYFTRAWTGDEQSVVMKLYSEHEASLELCIELRTRLMSAPEAWENPKVECLGERPVSAEGWQQFVYDFPTPSMVANRGARIRVTLNSPEAQEQHFFLDDIKMVSWQQTTSMTRGERLTLQPGNRIGVIGIRSETSTDDSNEAKRSSATIHTLMKGG